MKIIQIQVVPATDSKHDHVYALTEGGQILVHSPGHSPPWFELELPQHYAPQLWRGGLDSRIDDYERPRLS